MALHKVLITETRKMEIWVAADFDFNAPQEAEQKYNLGWYVSDMDDNVDVKFELANETEEI